MHRHCMFRHAFTCALALVSAWGLCVTEVKAQEKSRYDRAIEGMERVGHEPEPMFVLWRGKEDPRALLCEVPSSMLSKPFVIAKAFAGGTELTGFPISESVYEWRLKGQTLLLVEPQHFHVADGSSRIEDAVSRTYRETIRGSADVIAMKNGGCLIDLGRLLKSTFSEVGSAYPGQSINSQLSQWEKIKAFPLNVEICVALALRQPGAPESHDLVSIHYSMWKLPSSNGYRPRVADDRVGYFITARNDWSTPVDARDTFRRYIQRWDLRKANPNQALSEPVQPIVFYIEQTVPPQYRTAVREGILEWNKAFRAIGLVGAVEVRQQDPGKYDDIDLEDMRYPSFRWVTNPWAFAMGPSRVDPRTGQILDADIIMSDSMLRAYGVEAESAFAASLKNRRLAHDPGLARFFERTPAMLRSFESSGRAHDSHDDAARLLARYQDSRKGCRCQACCDYSEKLRHELLIAQAGLHDQPKEIRERFLFDVVKEVTMHEVGHALGLRHNFKASTVYSLEEIKARRKTGEALVGSVMDYSPVVLLADDLGGGSFVTPTIGAYDYWAIEYGYRPDTMGWSHGEGAAAAPKNEAEMLKALARMSTKKELRYATDEDTTYSGIDPGSNRFDLGDNPIEWAEARIAYVDARMKSLLEWSVKDGESYHHARSSFLALLSEKAYVFDYVTKMIGGQHYSRAHKGDPDAPPPFTAVDADLQRSAFAFMEKTLFAPGFFDVEAKLLNHLSVPRWYHQGANPRINEDLNVNLLKSSIYAWHIFDVYYSERLMRVENAAFRAEPGQKLLTLAEYLREMQRICWADAIDLDRAKGGEWTDSNPFLKNDRIVLQNEHLWLIDQYLRIPPGSIVPINTHELLQELTRELGRSLQKVEEEAKLDLASRAHIRRCRERIDRILMSPLSER